jgi:hypothetical protein
MIMHRTTTLLLVAVLAVLAPLAPPGVAVGQQGQEKDEKPKKDPNRPVEPSEIAAATRRTERLFGSDEPLVFTLTSDYKQAFKNRDTLNVKRTKATMVVNDTSGNPVTIAMEISPRGHFRLRNDVCNFPPIKLHFPDSGLKNTPFAGQKGLKLGTHCRRNDKEYAEYPVREHAAYEIGNMLTDVSFRSRLVRVNYVQTGDEKDTVTTLGLIIEDEDDVAKRNSGRVQTIRGGGFADMDPQQMLLASVFAYFLGNTDWSVWSLHNYRLIMTNDGRYVPVPYDFDWSGIVYARYAKPAPQLGIKTVQERLYRGPCATPEEFGAIFAKFNEKRDAFRQLYARLPLSDGYRRMAQEYIDDFYEVINDQRQARREFIQSCSRASS